MEYNTTRAKLLLPEYGRNVQNMISYAMKIEDRDERNRASQAIIEVMGQLNPHLRDVDDYRHKLWTHLFIMSDFQLDVDSPYEIPQRESLEEKPLEMDYPKSKINYGHFGQYTEKILQDSANINDENERNFLSLIMGNYMKKQFLKHNNTAVENTVIAEKLSELSNGNLTLENPDEDLISTNQLLKTLGLKNTNNRKSNSSNHKKQYKKKQYKK